MVMAGLGGWELAIILVIVLLVFGIGRIGKLGEELGKSISSFRKGLKEGQEDLEKDGLPKKTEEI
jgi:sec-independent protein translocase protein TatA